MSIITCPKCHERFWPKAGLFDTRINCPFCNHPCTVPPTIQVPAIDLSAAIIPPAVLAWVPESTARENTIIPISFEGGVLKLATADPADFDLLVKVQFILNTTIQPMAAPKEQIVAAIERYYGAND